MKSRSLSLALASIAAAQLTTAAMADHNSVNGAGWANMSNDIHNSGSKTISLPTNSRTPSRTAA